jgi:N-acetylglutamate synthase-like GNAT family acetyltransferase
MQAAMQLEIRRAVPEDASAIATVLHESFVEFKALYTDGGFSATALGAERILERMREGPLWIALRDGIVLGTVAAVLRGKSVYLRGMAVLPSARGSGAGTRLLQQVENWVRSKGRTRIFLSTTPFLTSAIRLYERFGFRRTDEGLHDLFGTPLFTMEKTLEKALEKTEEKIVSQ